jgi:hypothetical protein
MCEDYPCCGCGPEGCIDFERIVKCKECKTKYHPDNNTEQYCYRCQVKDDIQDYEDHGPTDMDY